MRHKRITIRLIALVGLFAATMIIALPDQRSFAADNDCKPGSRQNDACNVIAGFGGNKVIPSVTGATIGGGGEPFFPNIVTGDFGSVGGGLDNSAAELATVAGGSHNTAGALNSVVAGGTNNKAITAYATIAGGTNNTASSIQATVGGGGENTASSRDATIAGGSGNIASFTHATVGGGTRNTSSSLDATVAGGSNNTSSGAYATVGGGAANGAAGLGATIAGGSGNLATGDNSTIGGGLTNQAIGKYATVGGGSENRAGGTQEAAVQEGVVQKGAVQYATVGGGSYNIADGQFSTVPGGSSNMAAGAFSLAAGRRSKIQPGHDGTFLFADSSDADFASLNANEFAARATGGVRFVTAIDARGNPTAGVRLAKGSGSWEALSDRNAKANFTPVNGREILARLAIMPIDTWSYRTEDPAIRHIGPTAQDWSALGLGVDDQYINMMDATGVALAAIRELDKVTQEKDAQINELKVQNAEQQARIAALDSRLAKVEQQISVADTSIRSSTVSFPVGELALVALGLIFWPLSKKVAG